MDKFDTICRTCNAVRSNLISLNSNSPIDASLKLSDVLCSVCPSLSIQNDDMLPQKICYFCSKQLEIAYKFNLQCIKSHEELLKIVNDTIPKVTDTISNKKHQKSKQKRSPEQKNSKKEQEVTHSEESQETTTNPVGTPEFLDDDQEMEVNAEENQGTTILGEASFDCNHCDKKFLTSKGLVMHQKVAHKNLPTESTEPIESNEINETFQCNNCEKVCESKDDLKAHCWLEHKNDLKIEYSCYVCQKVFVGKNKLEHHMLYHGKQQYQCLVKDCKRTFNVKYKVTDHLKRFHGIILSSSQVKTLKPQQSKEALADSRKH